MNFSTAVQERRVALLKAVLALAAGTPFLSITILKAIFIANYNQQRPVPFISNIVSILRYKAPTLQLFWNFTPDVGLFPAFNLFKSWTFLLGSTVVIFGLANAGRWNLLNKRIHEAQEALTREQMLGSAKGEPQQKQSISDVKGGRDVTISQNVVHHVQAPPQSKTPLIVALIGALATILAALIGRSH